jgi:hypothetical protein
MYRLTAVVATLLTLGILIGDVVGAARCRHTGVYGTEEGRPVLGLYRIYYQ